MFYGNLWERGARRTWVEEKDRDRNASTDAGVDDVVFVTNVVDGNRGNHGDNEIPVKISIGLALVVTAG